MTFTKPTASMSSV